MLRLNPSPSEAEESYLCESFAASVSHSSAASLDTHKNKEVALLINETAPSGNSQDLISKPQDLISKRCLQFNNRQACGFFYIYVVTEVRGKFSCMLIQEFLHFL
jgi:hypothetical protein